MMNAMETKLIWKGRDQATARREREREKKKNQRRKRKRKRKNGINPARGRWIDDRCGSERDDDLRAFSERPGSNDSAMNRAKEWDREREKERERVRETAWRREERHVAKREAPPTVRISSRESPWLLECGPLGSRYIQVAQCRGSSSVYVYTRLLYTCTTWKNFRSSCLTRSFFFFFISTIR